MRTNAAPTLIGHVDSVKGGVVTVRVRDDIPPFIMVGGRSYRIGQVGAFVRIPLGYAQIYAVCTLVGAAAAPLAEATTGSPPGHRWIAATLFGEAIGSHFERGISQYPTIEDQVHVVTPDDLRVIYGTSKKGETLTIGHIASTSGLQGSLDLRRLVTRHCAIVGSTGAGKSNLVAVLMNAVASQGFPSGRVLVIDPHGEYASAVGRHGYVFRVKPDLGAGQCPLYIPFWPLPFDELQSVVLGQLQPASETAIRDEVTARKRLAAVHLPRRPPDAVITADSPIPFDLRRLWFDLDDYERQSFSDNGRTIPMEKVSQGSPETLTPNQYPAPNPGSQAPFAHPRPRNINRQLELLRSRLLDERYAFLLQPGPEFTPDSEGKTKRDLDALVASWVGHDRALTILDVSELPSEILPLVVGTMIRIIYDMLFWALDLEVSGRAQPLLMMLEEAHSFLPEGVESAAHRVVGRIAKEGRKYGIGICVVTQRPADIDATVLSQCGTMVALRLTNPHDRQKVESAMPDDLGALASMLPSLRTGEGIVLGEAMPIPSRIRFFRTGDRPHGDDPEVVSAWQKPRPSANAYTRALVNWRHRQKLEPKGES